ncbi:MAG: hypothetical protein ACRD1E_12105, partial [Terriglobales bacterium]
MAELSAAGSLRNLSDSDLAGQAVRLWSSGDMEGLERVLREMHRRNPGYVAPSSPLLDAEGQIAGKVINYVPSGPGSPSEASASPSAGRKQQVRRAIKSIARQKVACDREGVEEYQGRHPLRDQPGSRAGARAQKSRRSSGLGPGGPRAAASISGTRGAA